MKRSVIIRQYPLFLGGLGLFAMVNGGFLFSGETLDQKSCDLLFEHHLKVSGSDPDFSLQASYSLVKNGLQSGESRRNFSSWCTARVDRVSYECQMNAKTMKEIFACPLIPVTAPSTETKTETPPATIVQNAGQGVTILQVNGDETGVTEKRCKKAYDHMLQVYTNPPEGDTRYQEEDFRKMVETWKTDEARNSFEKRCTGSFKSSDISCILGTSDPDIIQACLVQIP